MLELLCHFRRQQLAVSSQFDGGGGATQITTLVLHNHHNQCSNLHAKEWLQRTPQIAIRSQSSSLLPLRRHLLNSQPGAVANDFVL